jgi:hypothetical protein
LQRSARRGGWGGHASSPQCSSAFGACDLLWAREGDASHHAAVAHDARLV